jgi:predicted SAM-dependent methyltransferase
MPYFLTKRIKLWRAQVNRKLILKKIDRLISENRNVYLEIGSGPKKGENNWTTLDLCSGCDISYDLSNGIPFPNNSVNMIYSSHLLEHFYYKDLLMLLNECQRVLKEGGCISLCVPDASIYIKKYLDPENVKLEQIFEPAFTINSPIDYINYIAYMDSNHRFMFDENNMLAILNKVGFRNVSKRKFESQLDNEVRKWESLYFSALK